MPTVADLLSATPLPSVDLSKLAVGDSGPLEGSDLFTVAAVDDPVGIIHQPVPRYPPALAYAGITGRVELMYVVDTTGRAEPGSLRVLVSSHPAFEAAARESVTGGRSSPARLHGRMVRQLVRQALSFRVGD